MSKRTSLLKTQIAYLDDDLSFAPLNRVIYDTHHEQWINISIALSWQKPSDVNSSKKSKHSNGLNNTRVDEARAEQESEEPVLPFNEELKRLLDTVERAYYFGVFTVVDSATPNAINPASEQTHTEIAAFRHIKDKKSSDKDKSGIYYWHIYNPRYKRPIEVTGAPKKYRAWCRKIVEADIY